MAKQICWHKWSVDKFAQVTLTACFLFLVVLARFREWFFCWISFVYGIHWCCAFLCACLCFFEQVMCNFASFLVGVLGVCDAEMWLWFGDCLQLFGYTCFCIQLSIIIFLQMWWIFLSFSAFLLTLLCLSMFYFLTKFLLWLT